MATPKVMKLVDAWSGAMECRVCGATHTANIAPGSGGRFYRGSWQCVNNCKLPEKVPARKPRRGEVSA